MIRIATSALCPLLTDLCLTTAPEDGAHPNLAGVLLYTSRGYSNPDEPGMSDVLVGMSTNRRVAGQAFVGCDGHATAMLWPVAKARAVIAMFKPKLKANKEHGLIITRDVGHVVVQEDPNLFDDGDRFEFKLGPIEDFPGTALAHSIDNMPCPGPSQKVKPRTDFYPADLVALCTIAKNRNTLIDTYRVSQDDRILVTIGDRWRGWIKPVPYEQGKQNIRAAAYEPSDHQIFYPDLPLVDEPVDAGSGVTSERVTAPDPAEPPLPFDEAAELDRLAEAAGLVEDEATLHDEHVAADPLPMDEASLTEATP